MARYDTDTYDFPLPDEITDSRDVDRLISTYLTKIEQIQFSDSGKKGLELLEMAHSVPMTTGPHMGRSFIYVCNAMMKNLLILRGVQWMLQEFEGLFNRYETKFSQANLWDHHICASEGGESLDCRVVCVNPVNACLAICETLAQLRVGPTATKNMVVSNLNGVDERDYRELESQMQSFEQVLLVDIESKSRTELLENSRY